MSTEELFSRIKSLNLYPPFLAKLKLLVENCRKRGAVYYVTSGERTFAEQDALYAKGRSLPGGIVTKVKGGGSLHNYAIAVDLVYDKDPNKEKLQPDWDDKYYTVLAEEAVALDLESGFYWKSFKDSGHVQLPLGKHNISIGQLLVIYKAGGKVAVFDFLDQFDW